MFEIIWVDYNGFTVTSLGIMLFKGISFFLYGLDSSHLIIAMYTEIVVGSGVERVSILVIFA